MTKQQNEMINQYILDCIRTEGYDVTCNTDKEKLQFLYDTFKGEQGYNIARSGKFNAYKDWLMGLSCAGIDFEDYKILELAKLWGSIPENATEKQKDKIFLN